MGLCLCPASLMRTFYCSTFNRSMLLISREKFTELCACSKCLFPRSVGCKRRFSGLLEISHWNAHAETPCIAVACGKSHTPQNLPECKLLEPNHYVGEIERLSKQDYGKEEQMISILGIKIPWESRGSKERG